MEPSVRPRNGFGVTALVLGIVGIVLAWTGGLGLVLGIIALVFGILALVKHQSKGFGLTGVILGGVAIIIAVIALLFQLVFIGAAVHQAAKSVNSSSSSSSSKTTTSVNMGTPVSLSSSGIKITASSVTDPAQPANDYMTPANGNKLVAVNFTVQNIGSSTYKDDADNATSVIGSDNQNYTASMDPVNGCTDFDNGQITLSAGDTLSGCVSFEIPTGVTVAKVQFTTNSGFSDETAEWQNP